MTLRACWLSSLQQWEWKPGCRRDFLFLASGSWWAPGRQHLGQAGLCALGISRAGECWQRDIGSIFLFDCADSFPKIAPEIIGLWEHILSALWKTPISCLAWIYTGFHLFVHILNHFNFPLSNFPCFWFLLLFLFFPPKGQGKRRDLMWVGTEHASQWSLLCLLTSPTCSFCDII